jgi:hypothetical protein
VQHVRVRPHPELDSVRVRQRRQVLDRHDAPERAGPGVHGVVGSGDPTPDSRVHPVGTDDEVGALDAAIGELQHHRIALLDDVDEPAAEAQVLRTNRAGERFLQVSAVDAEIGSAKPLLVPVVLTYRVGGDSTSVLPAPKDELGGNRGFSGQLILQAESREFTNGVGGQRDRGADFR